jgi:hypothetical protein
MYLDMNEISIYTIGITYYVFINYICFESNNLNNNNVKQWTYYIILLSLDKCLF